MVSGAAYGVYKVDQASGQWQWYSLDDRPTGVGGREHVLPQGHCTSIPVRKGVDVSILLKHLFFFKFYFVY